MRVCMVAYSFYDSDNRVMRYAEALARRGDSVEVLSLRYEGQAREEFVERVKVFRIQGRTKNEQSPWTHLLRITAFFLRALLFLTFRHIHRPYDLIHVHSIPDFLVFAGCWPRITGCPVILDIHDLLPEFYRAKFEISPDSLTYKTLVLEEQMSAAMAHYVIVPNHLWRDRVVDRSARPNKCMVILNAPDRSIFHARTKKRCDGKFIVLYPGSLNQHQGVDIAIRAVSAIRHRVPELELHIYGSGPEQQSLEALVKDLGLERTVFLRSARPIREIAEIMRDADLGVVPKRGESFGDEAFSTKILEFMAVGVPVVVSSTTVDRYYFNDSIVKFFPSGDADALARAITELARKPELRERLVANGLAFVRTCDWESTRGEYLALVDNLTAASGTHRTQQRAVLPFPKA